MKNLFLLCIILICLTPDNSAQFVRIWEKSASLGNLPSWFSPTDNRERGIAYSVQNGKPRLYVISNRINPTVIILNALTGDSVGSLNTNGIAGGIIPINDIETSEWDTGIYACNLTDDPITSPFKIYKWNDEFSLPVLYIIDSVSNTRLGDHLDCYLSYPFHFVIASSNTNKVIDYHNETGVPPFIKKEVTLSDGNMANNASAAFNLFYPLLVDFGGYFVNSDGNQPKAYDTSGVLINISADTLISPFNNTLKYYANGTLCCDAPFYLTYNYDEDNAELVLSTGYFYENYYGNSPSLGGNSNPENYGDVELFWRAIDSLYVFVLGGNNGIGTYFVQGLSIPVELTSFTAERNGNDVYLRWSTATETNNRGFEVQRSEIRGRRSVREDIGFVEGNGTTVENHSYRFTDNGVSPGKYVYRLKQIDFDGSYEYSKEVEVIITALTKFSLEQNYPNPFNPTTTISYELSVNSIVILKVYNTLGEEIESLVNEEKPAGRYEVEFDGNSLPSGVYIYRLTVGDYTEVKKLVLLK